MSNDGFAGEKPELRRETLTVLSPYYPAETTLEKSAIL
jgi:hypothetical protein